MRPLAQSEPHDRTLRKASPSSGGDSFAHLLGWPDIPGVCRGTAAVRGHFIKHFDPIAQALVAAGLCTHLVEAQADGATSSLPAVEVRASAEAASPDLIQISPESSRPISTLTRQAIDQFSPKFADFGTLANLLPSFVSSAPNGNAFDAAKSMTLRGFPDGQFNVTLDGIPFADPDGFGHHSTSIFPSSSIEQLSIDRSPGSGAALGHSGIGGTLNISSLAVPRRAAMEVYGAYGSFETSQVGALLNTAAPAEVGETGLLLNVQHLQSRGAMANASGRRDDVLLKSESRFEGFKLTLLYSYDDYHFFNPPSVTTDELARGGSGVGFSRNPALPDYNLYAQTDRVTDIGYVRLQADAGRGSVVSETAYTYSYRNQGLSANGDVTLAKSYQVGTGFGVTSTDVAGRLTSTSYRTVGNIAQWGRDAEEADSWRVGLWLEHSRLNSYRDAVDLTTGDPYNANTAAASPVLYDYHGQLDTIASYADYVWKATPQLIVRAGARYQHVTRRFDAAVVPTSRPGTPGELSHSSSNLLPSLEANYALSGSTHVYGQWARGALIPNQSFFYTSNPALGNQAGPQTSQALQTGVVYVAGPVELAVDVYHVDVENYVSQVTDANKNTLFVNNGKVRYRGIEAEGEGSLGLGFGIIGNASLLRAEFREDAMATPSQRAGDTIPLVPSYTGLLGVTYRHAAWSGSVLAKFVGVEYQGPGGSADGPDRRVAPYHYLNMTATRELGDLLGGRRSAISLQIANLENRTPITDSAGRAAIGASGPLLVNVLARRSFTIFLRSEL